MVKVHGEDDNTIWSAHAHAHAHVRDVMFMYPLRPVVCIFILNTQVELMYIGRRVQESKLFIGIQSLACPLDDG